MDPIYILGIIALVLIFFYLMIRWASSNSPKPEPDKRVTITGLAEFNKQFAASLKETLEREEDRHSVGEHLDALDAGIHDLSREVETLKNQVDHLATVQMLILKQLNVEHQIMPERDVLVPLESFSDSKKPTKERLA